MRPPAISAAITESTIVPLLVEISFCAASILGFSFRCSAHERRYARSEFVQLAFPPAGDGPAGRVLHEIAPDVAAPLVGDRLRWRWIVACAFVAVEAGDVEVAEAVDRVALLPVLLPAVRVGVVARVDQRHG